MPKVSVKIYDENNNFVTEVPYGQNGITGTVYNNERQQVYQDTDKNGNTIYVSAENFTDPFIGAGKEIQQAVSIQAPKVGVSDGKITLSGSQAVLDSPLAQQIRDQVQVLKGSDLSSAEVQNALKALNDEIQTSISNQMIESALGWSPDEFKDYQYAVQTVNVTNPMQSQNKLKAKRPGADFYTNEDGSVMEKTPQEWIDYWRTIFSTDQRNEMFKKSLESDDPYERVMALIMSKGEENPVYGFDNGERIAQNLTSFKENLFLFPKGVARIVGTSNDVKRLEDLIKDTGIDIQSTLRASDFMSWNADDGDILSDWTKDEDAFNKMKEDIAGKTWRELSDIQRLFLLEVGVSKETSSTRPSERGMIGDDRYYTEDLKNVNSENDSVSREAINDILVNNSYDEVKKINSDFLKWQAWDEKNVTEPQQKLAANSNWAASEIGAGAFFGTIGRYLWENAVGKALTGHSMNKISDVLGEKIVNGLNKIGISPASSLGQGTMTFVANLAGTIPEDFVQTAVDNVVTYNSDQNENLINFEDMSQNLKNNLLLMSLFNAGRAGWSAVKRAMIVKNLSKMADLGKEVDIGVISADADDAARAVNDGGEIKIDGDRVYVENVDGSTTELKNTTPEQGKMMQQSLFDWVAKNTDADATDDAAKAANTLKTPEFDDAVRAIDEATAVIDDAGKSVDEAVDAGTIKVDVDTPDGVKTVETQDYNFKNIDDVISPDLKIEPTKAGLKAYRIRGLNTIMREFKSMLREFHNRFGDVRASDFGWVRYNSERGLSPNKIIGTIDPTTNRVVTQNMIDAMKWWGEQPVVKKLRTASLKALGKNAEDYNILGYLPNTSYDPTILPLDEVIFGQLWKKSTGASVLKDGKYVGYGGTLEGRFRTFASNMLWDIRNKEVTAAKLIEEAEMDGKKITPEQALKATNAGKAIYKSADDAKSTKGMNKLLENQGEYNKAEWDAINEEVKKEAPNCGAGKAIHDGFADVYMGANSKNVAPKQPGSFELNFNQMSDNMKKISIGDGMTMYEWGGADIIYGYQNAAELFGRWERAGSVPSQFRQMVNDYIIQHSHRSAQYAEAVTDRIMQRIASSKGGMVKGNVIEELGKAFRSEGMSRLRKWLVMAKYDQFNDASKKYIDTFLFNKMQLDSVSGNTKVKSNLAKFMNLATEARYDAIFYGNIKNSLLQISELNRLFTTFKWGDVAKMFKRLATDADFRDRVNLYVEAVAPQTSFMDSEIYGSYHKAAEGFEVDKDGVTFKKIKGTAKEVKDVADKIGLAPINAAESIKNRTMVAAILQEAESKNISGNELLPYMRSRFERVALAADEMGKIGLSSNPLAKPLLFLQNFQIRELGMHYYNIKDATGMVGGSKFKKAAELLKYASKVLGTKMATTLLLARVGYSASQTLGLDPFGLLNNYNQMDEDEMNWWDKQISGGILTPLFSGGMTSLISELYFMARDAYEDSVRETVSEDAEAGLENPFAFRGLDLGAALGNGGFWGKVATGFVPGSTLANRIGQMNEMMDTGWATSATGNKMYTAPEDMWNVIKGYLFGRNATQNALNYNQNYGNDLWQTLGRMNPFRNYNEFDPIDTKNYSDWFDGSENDAQQFNKGKKYFQQQRDAILDAYEESLRKNKYASDEEKAEAKNDMNDKLNTLWQQLNRFVNAYEEKHGSITGKMVKDIINLLNTDRDVLTETAAESTERSLSNYDKALSRYADLGLPNVGTYTGPSNYEPDKEVKYQGSPQWRTSSGAKYDLYSEAIDVLKQADVELKDLRNELKDPISKAYDAEDYDSVTRLQKQYLNAFDNVVSPIVAMYGSGIFSSTDVVNQIKDMLSTGTSSRSGDLIPSEQYRKDKYGRYRSMPLETVDVKKWAQQRFSDDLYKNPTVRSYSTTDEDISEIKRLSAQGKNQRAKARALQLKTRVDNQRRSLSKDDYQWLLDFLNNGGK